MLLQIKLKPKNVNIIQIYAPTANKSDVKLEQFYAQVKQLRKQTKKEEVNIIIRYLNTKVRRDVFF